MGNSIASLPWNDPLWVLEVKVAHVISPGADMFQEIHGDQNMYAAKRESLEVQSQCF